MKENEMDLTALSPAPWRVCPLKHDDWGVLRDAADMRVASFSTGSKVEDWKEANKDLPFTSEAWQKGPPEVWANAEFCALARAAFDILLRRKWLADFVGSGWIARDAVSGETIPEIWGPSDVSADPYTALVAADEWMKANVEAGER